MVPIYPDPQGIAAQVSAAVRAGEGWGQTSANLALAVFGLRQAALACPDSDLAHRFEELADELAHHRTLARTTMAACAEALEGDLREAMAQVADAALASPVLQRRAA